MKNKILLLCLILICFSCSKKAAFVESSYDESYYEAKEEPQMEAMASSKRLMTTKDSSENLFEEQIERKLIKIGNINFETDDIKRSRILIDDLVAKYGAYINN
ncbi:MAG: hypothetical protein ACTTKH_02060 [Treponema sp.]